MENSNNFFNFLSSDTKKVLLNCQKIARDTHSITGTDHLLLSLLTTPSKKAQIILQKYINSSIDHKILFKMDDFPETIVDKNVTREFKDILKIAADNKLSKNQNYINPEDLLLAIISYKNCSAFKILRKLNVDTQKLSLELSENNLTQNDQPDNLSNLSDNFDTDSENIPNPFESGMFGMPQNPFFIQNPHKKNKKILLLEEYGTNLTNLAKENKLDKVIGREKETNRIIQILCRRTKNNPVLVGDPGIGKTAIIEGLAQKISSGCVPQKLIGKSIIMLDLAMTVAGTMYRGQFEARIKKIMKEVKNNPDIILFIDEIHTMIGTGSAEGSMDTANILKPALAKGEIRLIGATTYEEYRKYIEKDTALDRRLQKINVIEPSFNDCKKILYSTKSILEHFHNVKINDNAIDSAIKLSERYLNDKFLPDKAIDVLDEACASVHLNHDGLYSNKLLKLEKSLKETLKQKESAIEKEDFPQAAYLRSQELKIKEKITSYKLSKPVISNNIIDEHKIAKVVSDMTNIPIENLSQDNYVDVKNLAKKISKNIIGQNEAIQIIVDAIKKTKTKLSDPHRPLGTFIFLGPTGVGKTELAKILAKNLFGSEKKLIKIDMSEFMERHNISRLVGAPPGYIGYDDAGKLTEAVRKNPYSIILLDEIEKAHSEISNILLQIMEDGYLTDAKGRQINFRNTIIIMTSNIGVSKLNEQASIGFEDETQEKQYKQTKDKIIKDLKKTFKPEFINRLDNIIIFDPLSKKTIEQITKLKLLELSKRLKDQNISVDYSKDVIKFLSDKSYVPEYGAREVRRIIQKHIVSRISDLIINTPTIKNIRISCTKNILKFDVK